MKNIRKFENRQLLNPNSSVVTDELNAESILAELQNHEIGICQSIRIPENRAFSAPISPIQLHQICIGGENVGKISRGKILVL